MTDIRTRTTAPAGPIPAAGNHQAHALAALALSLHAATTDPDALRDMDAAGVARHFAGVFTTLLRPPPRTR